MPRESPSSWASPRVDGRSVPAASRPWRIAARSADSRPERRPPVASSAICRSSRELDQEFTIELDLNVGPVTLYGRDRGLTAAAGDWLSDAERAGRAHQDYSAVLAHIPHTATKGPQR